MQLGAVRKSFSQLGEDVIYEGLLTKVVAGERVGAHHCPVNIVGYVFEEGGPSRFQVP